MDAQIKNEAARALRSRGINPEGRELDRKFLGRNNWLLLKTEIDRRCNLLVGRKPNERSEFTQQELDRLKAELKQTAESALQELIDAKT